MLKEGISVIIPVYNSEKTIAKCLDSICNQTYTDLQIICINDGSSDNSVSVIEKYRESDPRIELYSQANQGSGAARNNGIQHADNLYITFIDSDDEIELNTYARMLDFLKSNALDCVACEIGEYTPSDFLSYLPLGISDNMVRGKKQITESVIKPLIGFKERGNDCLPSMVNKLFITKIIKENHILVNIGRSYGEDWEFCINYFRHIDSIGVIHEPLYHYIHWTQNSLTSRFQANHLEMELDSFNKFHHWFPELEWNSADQKKKLFDIPVNAAVYYRTNLRGERLHQMLDAIYSICMSDDVFTEYARIDSSWNKLIKDKRIFDRYIRKSSDRAVAVYKIKKWLKGAYRCTIGRFA